MEPKTNPIKSRNVTEALQPTVLCPVDTDDYFELAYEADEFGVHVADQSVEK